MQHHRAAVPRDHAPIDFAGEDALRVMKGFHTGIANVRGPVFDCEDKPRTSHTEA